MRIIAGIYGGRVLKAPQGRDTRPTTDRVRESMMSMVQSAHGFENARVLDAFAGSGALGFEALSRGAARVCAFEQDTSALKTIKDNAATLGLTSSVYRVKRADVYKQVDVLTLDPFDIVFLDPPYAMLDTDVLNLVSILSSRGQMVPDAVVMYEHAAKQMDSVKNAAHDRGFVVVKSKKYGDTALTLMSVSAESSQD